MDTQTSEQALRYEAVLRRALGHRVCDICRDLERSPRWLNKWWRELKAHPETDFAEQARAPHTSPHKKQPKKSNQQLSPSGECWKQVRPPRRATV